MSTPPAEPTRFHSSIRNKELGMSMNPLRRTALAVTLCAALAGALPAARAHSNPSDASALSALPIAVSVAAPVMILSAGAVLSVVAVQAASQGTVWILERASDGARASITLSAQAAGALSVAAGTVVLVTAVSTGWVISAAGTALAFIPNQLGAALLHNERLTR
jgi:hypothetical protein